jgi:hypothetical protein
LFDDLDPNSSGTVSWQQLQDRLVVTFEDVPEFGAGNSNSFQIEMFFEGTISITYLNIDAADGLTGLSDGGGLTGQFVETTLSDFKLCADFDDSDIVDINDLALLMNYWLQEDCAVSGWCQGTDLDRSSDVNMSDYAKFLFYWGRVLEVAQPVQASYTLYSIPAEDGRVWDDRDDGFGGGTGIGSDSSDFDAYALRLGDYGRYGYKSILSFDTSVLPPDAQITNARLEMTKGYSTGTSPFVWGGNCLVDMARPYYGIDANIENQDWQSPADENQVAEFTTDVNMFDQMTSTLFNGSGMDAINKNGRTQCRIHFAELYSPGIDPDYFGLYSAETDIRKQRPKLIIDCMTLTPTVEFNSLPQFDGRVWAEVNDISSQWEGVDVNTADDDEYSLRLGHWASYSYRVILSFDTSSLTENCSILSTKLEMTRSGWAGNDPFGWGGKCYVDIGNPHIGDSNEIEASDWQAPATMAQIAEFTADPGDEREMLSTEFSPASLAHINKSGITQFRVYFENPAFGSGSNYLSFRSGESAPERSSQPRLIIKYSLE